MCRNKMLGIAIALLGIPELLILDISWGNSFGCVPSVLV